MSQSQCGRTPSQAGYPSYALVSRYLTNKLIGREFIPKQWALRSPLLSKTTCVIKELSEITTVFTMLCPTSGKIIHVFLTRLPL